MAITQMVLISVWLAYQVEITRLLCPKVRLATVFLQKIMKTSELLLQPSIRNDSVKQMCYITKHLFC